MLPCFFPAKERIWEGGNPLNTKYSLAKGAKMGKHLTLLYDGYFEDSDFIITIITKSGNKIVIRFGKPVKAD
jgi:hypothetical protein